MKNKFLNPKMFVTSSNINDIKLSYKLGCNDPYICLEISSNKKTPSFILKKIYYDNLKNSETCNVIRHNVALHKNTPKELLKEIAMNDPEPLVKAALFNNPKFDMDLLLILVNDKSKAVRYKVIKYAISKNLHSIILGLSYDKDVRELLKSEYWDQFQSKEIKFL